MHRSAVRSQGSRIPFPSVPQVNRSTHDAPSLSPSEEPSSSRSFVESFAQYRSIRRRLAAVASRGIRIPFFEPRQGTSGASIRWGGREVVNYSGYNYLGLSGHPAVNAAAKAAIDQYGTSASASRVVSGQIDLHGELERRIARFVGAEDAIVFVSGYLTNLTTIGHLLGRNDAAIYDSGAHNSIINGALLSKARVLTFPCGDWQALDRVVGPERASFRRGLLIVEGVYSMDGDVVDLPRAVDAARRHNLLLMVDEAHSLGTLGATGRGVTEQFGVPAGAIDVLMGTLSKSLAGCGGYIAGNRELIEYLRFSAPGFVFSVGLSPPDTAAALAALDLLEREPQLVQRLRERVRVFRSLGREYGIELTGDADAPVAAYVVGQDDLCLILSQRLLAHGVHVQPVVHPGVAPGQARLRFFISNQHTDAQFRKTLSVLAREREAMAVAAG